ncbi:CE1759 family FMN reductase [Streptomyces sp. NPDC008313]|uniref:CE1759 family FMN reductase n=1 Tax=Streptomyces sp. NPDC008313 TaxID=3364826 RepID=UPI0036ECA76F
MRLVVVSAGLSVPSSTRLLADRLAEATARRAATARPASADATRAPGSAPDAAAPGPASAGPVPAGSASVDVQVVELRELAVEIAHNFTNGFPGPALSAAIDAVTAADGLIVVTPVFSASYSGLFKSFFDVLSVSDKDAVAGTPVLIAATGGTARHSLVLEHALRPLFAYLRAIAVPTGVYAASEDWGAEGLAERIERAAGELAGLMAGAAAVTASTASAAATVPTAPATAATAASTATAAAPVVRGAGGGVPGPASATVVPFAQRLAALRP